LTKRAQAFGHPLGERGDGQASLAAFIAAQKGRARHPVRDRVSGVGVSQAWFYKWRDGDVSIRRARRQALAAQIAYVFIRHRRRYGSPRIVADLREQGWRASKNTVSRSCVSWG